MPRTRLHIGCGPQILAGWTNVDNQAYPGVDHVLDVTLGLPFTGVEYVFAEHFIEHLSFDDGLNFMRECRRVLADDGILRLTTPNLDWVMDTHYRRESWSSDADAIDSCFRTNRAFRGWGHQFLYNRQSLSAAARLAGFGSIEICAYGESRHELLRGIERHETYPDVPSLPHILVVELSGRGSESSSRLLGAIGEFRSAIDTI
jgi:predicted SAM-dependent methyltransferase